MFANKIKSAQTPHSQRSQRLRCDHGSEVFIVIGIQARLGRTFQHLSTDAHFYSLFLLGGVAETAFPRAVPEISLVFLGFEFGAGNLQLFARGRIQLGIAQVQSLQSFDNGTGHDDPCEPFVVRRHNIPRRVLVAVWRIMSS